MSYAIEVSDVNMVFNLNKEKITSFKEYLLKYTRHELKYEEFEALKNITFHVEKGDVFGIVGMNGSGKSTLLKIISGIMKPSSGKIYTEGMIAPLIELGAGFDPELSAKDNIFLNGSVLGYSKKYLEERFDDIVDFSEMKEFINAPIKNFSTGMVARIAFSIATITKPDILILDEILAVGDFKFQEKCEKRIADLMSNGTTVLIVSHSIKQIESLCKHGLWLDHGVIKSIGEVHQVCEEYSSML